MNKLIQTIGSCFIACLALGLLTGTSQGSLSEDLYPDFGFETAPPNITSVFEDIVAHSNQGGKKKKKMLLFALAGRSMPLPGPGLDGSTNGLLVDRPDLAMPTRDATWTRPGTTLMLTEPSGFSEPGASGGGIVPAPGALLLLGIAAAGRHRRRRRG